MPSVHETDKKHHFDFAQSYFLLLRTKPVSPPLRFWIMLNQSLGLLLICSSAVSSQEEICLGFEVLILEENKRYEWGSFGINLKETSALFKRDII